MSPEALFKLASDYFLYLSCFLLLAGSLWLTFKMGFVQIRLLPTLLRMLTPSSRQHQREGQHTIPPYKAMLTAMSTTIGIGTIVAPVIAIHLGGPGALLGFLITSFLGSAATYAEVSLAIRYRTRAPNGVVFGGPMQYLRALLSPAAAMWYAIFCTILMLVWCGAQANQVAAILDSASLGSLRIPKMLSGLLIAVVILFLLNGGIKRIGAFSAKLVPLMFVLYVGTSLWIVGSNLDRLGEIFGIMWDATLTPYAMINGALVGGIVSTMRWGIFKGIHVSEAGIGTQAIPHSMAETDNPLTQGALGMVSTYTAGLLAFLSGCVALLTGTWEDPSLPLGLSMVAASYEMYFSSFGTAIIAICALLFGFGTVLGNSFNGSQCFGYLTNNRGYRVYFFLIAAMVFLGALADVTTVWALTDVILACMTLLHMTGLVVAAHRPLPCTEPIPADA